MRCRVLFLTLLLRSQLGIADEELKFMGGIDPTTDKRSRDKTIKLQKKAVAAWSRLPVTD